MKKIIFTSFLFISALTANAKTGDLTVKVTYYSPEIIRVEKFVSEPRMTPSVSVVMEPCASVVNPKVKVRADKDGRLTFTDARGRKLLSESEASSSFISEGADEGFYKVSQGWILGKDEPIYGLGMLQNGKMNQRGENRLMVQSNLEDFTNFFQSVKGYGVFWDNYSPTLINDDGTELRLESEVAEEIDYYFIYGGDCQTGPATVIKAVSAGKVAARNIDTYLGFDHPIKLDVKIPQAKVGDKLPAGRIKMMARHPSIRKHDFDTFEIGMNEQELMLECNRCLRCDHFGMGAFREGRSEQW